MGSAVSRACECTGSSRWRTADAGNLAHHAGARSHAAVLGELPELGLADAGYRSEDKLKNAPIEIGVALSREGKEHAEVDARQCPHTAAMAAKVQTDDGRAAYRKRKWIAGPPNGWIKNVLGSVSSACGGCTGYEPSGSSCAWR